MRKGRAKRVWEESGTEKVASGDGTAEKSRERSVGNERRCAEMSRNEKGPENKETVEKKKNAGSSETVEENKDG